MCSDSEGHDQEDHCRVKPNTYLHLSVSVMTSPVTSTIIDLQESEEPLLRARRTSSPPDGGRPHSGSHHSPASPGVMVSDLFDDSPSPRAKKPIVIPPPVLRPQHVYAPVAPMGMLTLGLLSKHKDQSSGQGSNGGLTLGNHHVYLISFLILLFSLFQLIPRVLVFAPQSLPSSPSSWS